MKHVFKLLLPKNSFGDHVYALATFITRHHRLPALNGLINDALYQLKTSGELGDPLRVFTTDKEYVKLFVKAVVGNRYNIGTIGIIRQKDDVASFDFPARCCIKPTQTSGRYIIRKDGEPLPLPEIKKWFGINYYNRSREGNYKTLEPKVIVEPLVFDSENATDYKFYCYGGKVKFISVMFDRESKIQKRKIYDKNWALLNFTIDYPMASRDIEKPDCLPQMIEICEKLSSYFSLVRVDLYTNGTEFLVGEITHCPASGGGRFIPKGSEQLAAKILFSE